MTSIPALPSIADWTTRPELRLPTAAEMNAEAELVTAERDGYGTGLVTAERDGYGTGLVTAEEDGYGEGGHNELRKVFDDFVGQTFYGQMLSAMRKTVDKPAYFHGGRAEEVFQAQLDQTLADRLADATANQFTGPMFELFNLSRQ